jgi:hypothetical protein
MRNLLVIGSLLFAGAAFGEPPATSSPSLQAVFDGTSEIRIQEGNRPFGTISDGATLKKIFAAIGGAQKTTPRRRRCPDELQLSFRDGKGEQLGLAGFCREGAGPATQWAGSEFEFVAGGARGSIKIADPAALARLLPPANKW